MIGIDTNVLVRYLAQDHPIQSPKAADLIENRLTAETPGFITVVAATETVWVLDRAYGLSQREIARILERALQVETLLFENEQDVFAAMIAVKDGLGSFADALIGALGTKGGCTQTLTFDRKAARLPGFALL